jgi:hypothetical protein
MMKPTILCLLIVLSPPSRAIAQPWGKPVAKWSDSDARHVLSASPWAKRTKPRVHEAPSGPRGGDAAGPHATQSTVTVRWESAIPIQEAHRVRGAAPVVAGDQDHYAIAISGLRPAGSDALSASEAFLQYCDGEPARAVGVKTLTDAEGGPLLVFLFPAVKEIREPGVFRYPFGITFKPNTFEFVARVGQVEIKQKFDLRDMLYLRQLKL